jgi:hypothetical protein
MIDRTRLPIPLALLGAVLLGVPLLPASARAQGDTCADPVHVAAVPYGDFRTTCAYADHYGEACPAPDTSPDAVYEYTPTVDQCVEVRLCDSYEGFDFKLYVYSSNAGGCPAAGAGETAFDIACDDDRCVPHPRITNLQLERLVTYWFVVDSPGDGHCGTYHFEIELLGENCPEVEPDFVDRAIDRIEFLAGMQPGTKRLQIFWSAVASATADSIAFDCDLEIAIDGTPAGVLPETLRFHPLVPYPCQFPGCDPSGCGDWRRLDPFFDEEVPGTCFYLRAIPGVVGESCICQGLLVALTPDLPIAPGSVVTVRVVPARGGVPERWSGNDTASAVCCEPTVSVDPVTWEHVKRLYR